MASRRPAPSSKFFLGIQHGWLEKNVSIYRRFSNIIYIIYDIILYHIVIYYIILYYLIYIYINIHI